MLQRLPQSERPPVVVLGIFPLGARSQDAAPFGLGVTPMAGPMGRLRNALLRTIAERAIFGGIQREADAMARREVGRELGGFVLDWAGRADAYVQFTVPEFEYPARICHRPCTSRVRYRHRSPSVRFLRGGRTWTAPVRLCM